MTINPYSSEEFLLLVSPDEADHIALRRIMDHSEWTLLEAHDQAEAEKMLIGVPVAAVLADSICWRALLPRMRAMDFPLIVADRLADERLWAEVLNLGACDLVSKPFDAKEVLHVLSMANRRETQLPRIPVSQSSRVFGGPGGGWANYGIRRAGAPVMTPLIPSTESSDRRRRADITHRLHCSVTQSVQIDDSPPA